MSEKVLRRDDRKKRIVIEDGLVKIEEIRITKTMDLQIFNDALLKNIEKETPIFSRNTIFYKQCRKSQLVVVELLPGIYKIKHIAPNTSKEKYITYRLSFPYIYVAIKFNQHGVIDCVGAVVSKSAITNSTDEVAAIPMPNVVDYQHSGLFCLGSIRISVEHSIGSLRKVTEDLINALLMSRFNNDLSMYVPKEVALVAQGKTFRIREIDQELSLLDTTIPALSFNMGNVHLFFEIWEEESIKDPYIALQWSYLRLGTFENYTKKIVDPHGRYTFGAQTTEESTQWL